MQQALREKDRALADAQAAAEQARDEAKAARSAHAVARAQVTSQQTGKVSPHCRTLPPSPLALLWHSPAWAYRSRVWCPQVQLALVESERQVQALTESEASLKKLLDARQRGLSSALERAASQERELAQARAVLATKTGPAGGAGGGGDAAGRCAAPLGTVVHTRARH